MLYEDSIFALNKKPQNHVLVKACPRAGGDEDQTRGIFIIRFEEDQKSFSKSFKHVLYRLIRGFSKFFFCVRIQEVMSDSYGVNKYA